MEKRAAREKKRQQLAEKTGFAMEAQSTLSRGNLKRNAEGNTARVLHGCEYKGVAWKGICKSLKTKGE